MVVQKYENYGIIIILLSHHYDIILTTSSLHNTHNKQTDIKCVIFVVDSNDRDSIDDTGDNLKGNARYELHKMLAADELSKASLLVYANKQDLPNAMSVNEITTRLGLNSTTNRLWHVQSCDASHGHGLYEGLEWISKHIIK